MRKRRLWMAAVFAIFMAFLVWPRPPDGFEALRKFKPLEYKTQSPFSRKPEVSASPFGGAWYRIFRFADEDAGLDRLLKTWSPNPNLRRERFVVLPNRRKAMYYADFRMLIVYNEPQPMWLELQWLKFRHRFDRP